MKRWISILLSIIMIISNNSITSYAYSEDSSGEYWGEDARNDYNEIVEQWWSNKEKEYEYKTVSDFQKLKDEIEKDIKYLSVEFAVLLDYMAISDSFVFINENCFIITELQIDYENVLYYHTDRFLDKDNISDDLEKVISEMNYNMKDYNKNISELFNVWWYSLGDNAKNYTYLLDNINRQIKSINIKIEDYNSKYRSNYDTIDELYPVYPDWNAMYNSNQLNEYYSSIIWDFADYYRLDYIYPQSAEKIKENKESDKYLLSEEEQEKLSKMELEERYNYIKNGIPIFTYNQNMFWIN